MRSFVVLVVVLAVGSVVRAEPCIAVHSQVPEDGVAIRRVLVEAFPDTPGVCIDASVDSVVLDDSHSEISLTANLHVAISSARGQLTCVLAGGATLHVARAAYRPPRQTTYRRDVVEQAIGGMLPALRAHVPKGSRRSSR